MSEKPASIAAALPESYAAHDENARSLLTAGRRSGFALLTHPWLCRSLLASSDLVACALAATVAVLIKYHENPLLPISLYIGLWPLLLGFLPVFAGLRLYGLFSMSPADELRRIVAGCSLLYLLIGSATFIGKAGSDFSRIAFIIAWLGTIILVPLARAFTRALSCKRSWWGMPVIVLGAGVTGQMVVRNLLTNPQQGLRPVAIFDDDAAKSGHFMGVPVLAGLEQAPILGRELRIDHAILAIPGAPVARLRELEARSQTVFPHLIVIPNLCGFASLWVSARDLGGVLGLEVQRNLLMRGPRILKRSLDIILCILGGVLVLPFIALVAVIIACESRGPVFFGHERIGRGGKPFSAWKFRSMVRDAPRILSEYLAAHPELRDEWERDHKLRDDPRVTRVGRLLRKTSLDELPQLWNVLKGEMSLIGPRPIVQAEVERYADMFELYLLVRPGISGLWQISGRNDVTYAERVTLDTYYVRNWSVWLDVFILAKTVRVVLLGRGAY